MKTGSQENKLQILKKRADILAKPIERQELLENFIEVLVFNLGEEHFAIETKYITEVYPLKEYNILPDAPAFVYGLTNIRRKILLIIDLAVLFSIPNEINTLKKLLILGTDEPKFAIVTDGFRDIRRIPKDRLQPSLPTLTGIREDFLLGILIDGTVILDGQKLLTSKYLIVDETV